MLESEVCCDGEGGEAERLGDGDLLGECGKFGDADRTIDFRRIGDTDMLGERGRPGETGRVGLLAVEGDGAR